MKNISKAAQGITMEYRPGNPEDTKCIYKIVQDTIQKVYPKYYPAEIVDMFCNYHCEENIREDIATGLVYVLLENGKMIGTGTIKENHITRVYVLPDYQGKGYGTYIMEQLEQEIEKKYSIAQIDASLPACRMYYSRGYRTIDHGIWECANDVIQVYEIMEKELGCQPDIYGKPTPHHKPQSIDTKPRLRLRPYKNCDAKHILSWISDETAFRKWSADRYETYPITEEDINAQYMKKIDADNFYPMTAFDEKGVAGHLIMRFTDEEKQVLRFGFVIVDDKKRGMGYGKEMLLLSLKYAFEILKVNRVTLGVFENNPAAISCYQSVGFEETHPDKEEFCDILGEKWKIIEMEASL